ncbi:MAG TPA: pitrilysin family protein [Candidatus Limnocylindria bacterium]|nr:pitrilysin family protein [Candidatus Limnocylindria bacterium]
MQRLSIALLAAAVAVPSLARAQAVPTAVPTAALTAPASAQPTLAPAAGDGTVVRATLGNGLRVILLPNGLAPVATTLIAYGVGSDDDTMPGIAHATEHMLFRGTDDLSGGQLADIAARMGAEYNALTSNEFTLYYYKLPSAYVDVALHIEADRMTRALIRSADWATERGAIEQEIRAQESSPAYAVGRRLRETFFAGTPFAQAGGGTIPSFEKMTSAEIRAFYKTWYGPGNATLIVAGDIDPARTLAQIHREFDGIAPGTPAVRKPIEVPPLTSATISTTIDFPMGFAALGYRLPGSNDPDYAAAQVLAQVFDSGRNAFADLGAEGKVLGVLSMANAFPELGAAFLLAIPAQGSTPEAAQALVAGVLDDYRRDGVPADLVDAAKTRLLSEQTYAQSSISGLGFAWADANAEHHTPAEIYDAIAKVGVDDVDRVLRTYFTAEHRIAIVVAAKPSSTVSKSDPSAAGEHVGFTPGVHEPLPAWAREELNAPLRAPVERAASLAGRLPNGLRFSARRETASPTVVVSGVIRTSPELYEPKGKDGVSLLLDALLPWGTSTYDRKAYEAQLDAIAGTAQLGTSFSLRVQAKDFERGMALLADGLLHPALPSSGFAVVKTALRQGVSASDALPKTKAAIAERLALYPPGDPRRRQVTDQTVAAIAPADVARWYRFAFRPDETTIAVVGDVAPERVRAALVSDFGAWRAVGPAPTFAFPHLAQRTKPASTVTVKSSTSVQSEVTLKQVFTMRRGDADYVPLLLANTILSGEGTGSMLFQELRTHRGYVYTADSDFHVDRSGAEFSVSFASDPKNVAHADAAVVAIIKRLQAHPLAPVELQRAKALLLAQRILPLDSYSGVAAFMLAGAKDGYVSTPGERWFWAALLETTPAQVEHAMRRIDASHFVRVIVEPGS